jgi:tetratricopeptide (TPR) repeat protein
MVVLSDLCWYLLYDAQHDQATHACSRALSFAPTNGWIRLGLAFSYGHERPREALDVWLELLAGSDAPVAEWRGRDPAEAAETLDDVLAWFAERQRALLERGRGQSLNTAAALAVTGRIDDALEALEQAVAERQGFVVFLAVDPRFTNLRGTPAFDDLLRDLGLRTASPSG